MGNAGGPRATVTPYRPGARSRRRGARGVRSAPEGLRPGRSARSIDERANTLDVTATIVDLAIRNHLVIEEIEKTWIRQGRLEAHPAARAGDLLTYERMLLDRLFGSGDEVLLSELKNTFASKLKEVEESCTPMPCAASGSCVVPTGCVAPGWASAWGRSCSGWHLGVLALDAPGAPRDPAADRSDALLAAAEGCPGGRRRDRLPRRVAGFRRVIETAETHMSRWAEQEHVFTRYLPYAIVFGCTESGRRAFEASASALDGHVLVRLGRPFVYAELRPLPRRLRGDHGERHHRLDPGRLRGKRPRRWRVLRRRRGRRRRGVLVGSQNGHPLADRFEPRRGHRLLRGRRDFTRRDWSSLVTADPSGTFFHTPQYLKLYWEEFAQLPEHCSSPSPRRTASR